MTLTFDDVASEQRELSRRRKLLHRREHRVCQNDRRVTLGVPVGTRRLSRCARLVCEVPATNRLRAVRVRARLPKALS